MQFFRASCSKITHKTNLRKGIFHENWYFWHFLAKNDKNCPCTKVFVLIFTHFFNKSKSVENEKVFPNDLGVPKKFPPFKRKNQLLAIFVIFPKSQKQPTNNFFFWKVEIFLAHHNHLRKHYFFILNIFHEDKSNMVYPTSGTPILAHFPPLFCL